MLLQQSNLTKQRYSFLASFSFQLLPNPLEINALTYVVAKEELQVQIRKF